MPKIPQIASEKSRNNENNKFLQFVGPSCGHHASYTFYKAIKYVKNGHTKILSLGEFFFVKIWPNSDLVAIGELQLLWDDKNTNQTLSSLRLYFLPEYTPDGRMHYHGEVSTIFYYLFFNLLHVVLNTLFKYRSANSDYNQGTQGLGAAPCSNRVWPRLVQQQQDQTSMLHYCTFSS